MRLQAGIAAQVRDRPQIFAAAEEHSDIFWVRRNDGTMIESRDAISPINSGLADRAAAYLGIHKELRGLPSLWLSGREELKPSVCSTLLAFLCERGLRADCRLLLLLTWTRAPQRVPQAWVTVQVHACVIVSMQVPAPLLQ